NLEALRRPIVGCWPPRSRPRRWSCFNASTEERPRVILSYRQIACPNLRLLEAEPVPLRRVDDAPFDHDVQLVGDRLSASHVLLDQQYGDTALAQVPDDPRQLAHNEWRKPLTWFIEQQNFGIADEGTGDGEHLLLPARKLRPSVGLALAQRRKEFKEPRQWPCLGGIALRNLDVLNDAQVWKNQATLGHVGHAGARNFVRWPARDRPAIEHHRAPARWHQTHDGLDGCRFADAVAPEQASYASPRQIEIDALQDMACSVVRIETSEGEHHSIPPR